MTYVSSLPTSFKLDLRLPRGVGEKLLLRAVAFGPLGLGRTAEEPKRAIQFGSRIANKKEKGHHNAEREGNFCDNVAVQSLDYID